MVGAAERVVPAGQQRAVRMPLGRVCTKDCNIGGSTERREKSYPHKSRELIYILANFVGGWLQMWFVVLLCGFGEKSVT